VLLYPSAAKSRGLAGLVTTRQRCCHAASFTASIWLSTEGGNRPFDLKLDAEVMTTLDGDDDVTEKNVCVVDDNGQVGGRPVVSFVLSDHSLYRPK